MREIVALAAMLSLSLSSLSWAARAAKIVIDKSCDCGIRNFGGDGPSARIVGGSESGRHEFPWVVGLFEDRGYPPFCGGALLSDRHVLTAAHCLTEKKARYVSLGDHDYNSFRDGGRLKSVEDYSNGDAIHPKYEQPSPSAIPVYDVAMLRLMVPVKFRFFPNARPICLPNPIQMADEEEEEEEDGNSDDDDKEEEEDPVVAGWGKVKYQGFQSHVLLYATLPLVSRRRCSEVFRDNKVEISRVHLCAGATGSDACQGDSGSPLFRLRPTWDLAREDVFEEEEEEEEGVEARRKFRKRYELLGVTSFGARCGQVGVPGGFARASVLLRWIFTKMKEDYSVLGGDGGDDGDGSGKVVKVCRGFFGKWYQDLINKG